MTKEGKTHKQEACVGTLSVPFFQLSHLALHFFLIVAKPTPVQCLQCSHSHTQSYTKWLPMNLHLARNEATHRHHCTKPRTTKKKLQGTNHLRVEQYGLPP